MKKRNSVPKSGIVGPEENRQRGALTRRDRPKKKQTNKAALERVKYERETLSYVKCARYFPISPQDFRYVCWAKNSNDMSRLSSVVGA